MNRGTLWALLLGNFCIGAGVMVVPGTLNEISASLAVSPAAAGQLMTASALLICLGAPLFAALVAGWDRRRLLTLMLAWYAVMHLLCTLATSLGVLLPLRVLASVPPAVFTPQAAACVAVLVPPQQRAGALAFLFLGWSLASVLGTPLATWVGGHLGWQAAFGGIALLSAVAAVLVWRAMPDGVRPPALSRGDWSQVLRHRWLMGLVTVTALQGMGQFMLFSYMAPVLRQQIGADANTLSLVWLWFGIFALLGNLLMARYVQRLGPSRAAMVLMGGMVLSLVLWPWAFTLGLVLAVVVPWALACFAMNSAQQARLMALAPAWASASVALNTSAIYVGQAFGAGAGGWLLAHQLPLGLSWGGAAIVLLAMGLSAWLARGERAAARS